MYNASLNLGVALGAIIDGFIVKDHPWRYIYYVAIALIGVVTLIVYVTFPETAYNRNPDAQGITTTLRVPPIAKPEKTEAVAIEDVEPRQTRHVTRRSRSDWIQGLKLYHGVFTEESLWNMALRPIMLLALPPVLWATLVMSVTIGFIVAITSNVSPAFNTAYGFEAWQSGLCFFAAVIGALLGILLGGHFSDWVADQFTKRNGGIREPEMRLPAIMIGAITGPLALALYGCGIKYKMHWIVPTLGIGFSMFPLSPFTPTYPFILLWIRTKTNTIPPVNFTITQATNVSLVYTIDSYRPIAGEIVVTQLAFKSAFGFLLSFYTNPWVTKHGYNVAYGEMAAICGAILIFWIPFFVWGRRIRRATLSWPMMKYVRWDVDREVGE
jgi:Major Facilitator Superfamily